MAHPIDPAQGFMRTPHPYIHDQFAHDGAIDGCTRVRPHSGFDSTPRVPNARAQSVLGGKVVDADWTIYAGNYVVVEAADGWLWLDIHLASRLVRPGAVVAEGDAIGIVGNTGGGGSGPLAGKTGNLAVHLHTSRCRDMAAVNRIINGLVRTRSKGETSAQWAAAHGLSDPYPHILASLKNSGDAPAAGPDPAKPAPLNPYIRKEIDMLPFLTRVEGKDYLVNPSTFDRVLVENEADREQLDAAIMEGRKQLATGSTLVLGKANGNNWLKYLARLAAA